MVGCLRHDTYIFPYSPGMADLHLIEAGIIADRQALACYHLPFSLRVFS